MPSFHIDDSESRLAACAVARRIRYRLSGSARSEHHNCGNVIFLLVRHRFQDGQVDTRLNWLLYIGGHRLVAWSLFPVFLLDSSLA